MKHHAVAKSRGWRPWVLQMACVPAVALLGIWLLRWAWQRHGQVEIAPAAVMAPEERAFPVAVPSVDERAYPPTGKSERQIQEPPREPADPSPKALLASLAWADAEEKLAICQLLKSMRDPEAMGELVAALNVAADPAVLKTLRLFADRSITSDGVLELVRAYAGADDPVLADRVLAVLAGLTSPKAAPALIGLEARPEIRADGKLANAIWAGLAEIAVPGTLGVLAGRFAADGTEGQMRDAILVHLERVRNPGAGPALVSLAIGNKDSAASPQVRIAALGALVKNYPPEEWQHALPRLQNDSSPELRAQAEAAVRRKTKPFVSGNI